MLFMVVDAGLVWIRLNKTEGKIAEKLGSSAGPIGYCAANLATLV